MRVERIDSLAMPELEPYRTMRRTIEHRRMGIFVAEGEKVVKRLVNSQLKIVSILMTERWLEKYSPLLANRDIEEAVFVGQKEMLENIVGYGLHQGIMAIGRVPEPHDVFSLNIDHGGPGLLVALDGIANSENMGVIVRNCAAFGVDAVLVGETSCDPYLRRSVRNSMGTIFDIPIIYVEDLAAALGRMRKDRGFRMIAANPRPGSSDIATADLSGDVCIVFGSEGDGISARVLGECDASVKIPMSDPVDSINVASSVGVVLYECNRRRGFMHSQLPQ